MSKHPHLRLVVSKPDDWQPPRQKAKEVVRDQAPIFSYRHFYFAAIGSAVATVLTFALLYGIYHVIRMTSA